MSLLPILTFPNPVLRQKNKKVTEFDSTLTTLITDMVETMYDAPGIGLAAPQIGESIQLIVLDITEDDENAEKESMVMVNPVITAKEGKQVDEEGCLSLLDLTSSVTRSKIVTVSYQDAKGTEQELTAEDRFAVVLQHEIDHLHGILFLDYLSVLKRTMYKKKIKKQLAADKK